MTTYQTDLIEKLAAAKIDAKFNGDFLNCIVKITNRESGKVKRQKFSFVFDSADDCQGARLLIRSCKGTYVEAFAEKAAAIIFEHSALIAVEEIV